MALLGFKIRRVRRLSVLGVTLVSEGSVICFEGIDEEAEMVARGLGGRDRRGDLIAGVRQAEARGLFRTFGIHSHRKLGDALRSVEEVLHGHDHPGPASAEEKLDAIVAGVSFRHRQSVRVLKSVTEPVRVVLASFDDESIRYALGVLARISGGASPER